ncbi:MAG: N-acetyltransferase [Chloroflexi bacterium]|nr:N-acetyltransferase [Chloroflexota bacterium]
MIIRPETQQDIKAIEQVTMSAFNGKPYSDNTEPLIIHRLREAGDLSISLVAEDEGKVVGHVAFSIVTINGNDPGWYGLGPVSVLPELQKTGIGSGMIREGLRIIKEKGAKGCVLEGSPLYYQRFGFKSYPDLYYEGAPAPEFFMALPFYDDVPKGRVEFNEAFYNAPLK